MTNHLYYGDNLHVLRDRAIRLPARRDGTFKKAAREEDQKAQGKLNL